MALSQASPAASDHGGPEKSCDRGQSLYSNLIGVFYNMYEQPVELRLNGMHQFCVQEKKKQI